MVLIRVLFKLQYLRFNQWKSVSLLLHAVCTLFSLRSYFYLLIRHVFTMRKRCGRRKEQGERIYQNKLCKKPIFTSSLSQENVRVEPIAI